MADRRARRARSAPRAPDQHFLRSPRLAKALVRDAGVTATDLVVEFGAGTGRLTAPLADRARVVRAIELDPALAAGLRERFRTRPNVEVIEGDALRADLPAQPFRVVANPPFGCTGALLRRLLDDPGVPLERADLIVEWGVAVKRTACWPSTLLGVCWGVWFEFALVRRLPSACFEPKPSVHAALMRVLRRPAPLVPADEYRRFRALVGAGFRNPSTVRSALGLPSLAFKRIARELGFDPTATARELDLHQWVALHDFVSSAGRQSRACAR